MTEHAVKAPAIGVSIVCDLPPGKQMTLQTFFDQDAEDADANALVDRLVKLADRQRALASLPQLRKDLKKQEETLAKMQADFARLEAEHPGRIEALRAKILEQALAGDKIVQAAFVGAQTRGRVVDKDSFKLKGEDDQRYRATVMQSDQLEKEIERLEAERIQGAEVHRNNVAHFEREIAATRESIAEAEALAG